MVHQPFGGGAAIYLSGPGVIQDVVRYSGERAGARQAGPAYREADIIGDVVELNKQISAVILV